MFKANRKRWLQWVIPLVAVAAADLLTKVFWTYLAGNLSLLFITAVMVSAMYGGLGPAILASVLSALASAFFYYPPVNSLDLGFDDFLRLMVFIVVSLIVGWLSVARRRSEEALRAAHTELEHKVVERTAELQKANDELVREAAERAKAQSEILEYQGQLQHLAVDLSSSEERERRRIASVLHDAVGHALAVGSSAFAIFWKVATATARRSSSNRSAP